MPLSWVTHAFFQVDMFCFSATTCALSNSVCVWLFPNALLSSDYWWGIGKIAYFNVVDFRQNDLDLRALSAVCHVCYESSPTCMNCILWLKMIVFPNLRELCSWTENDYLPQLEWNVFMNWEWLSSQTVVNCVHDLKMIVFSNCCELYSWIEIDRLTQLACLSLINLPNLHELCSWIINKCLPPIEFIDVPQSNESNCLAQMSCTLLPKGSVPFSPL